jgi:hypothetical protein
MASAIVFLLSGVMLQKQRLLKDLRLYRFSLQKKTCATVRFLREVIGVDNWGKGKNVFA